MRLKGKIVRLPCAQCLAFIFCDDHLRYFHKRNIALHICLLTVYDNPLPVVKGHDILPCQMSHINIGETAKTGKDKYIPDRFKTGNIKISFHNPPYIVICEEASIHVLKMEVMVQEWVVCHHTALLCEDDNSLEKFECLYDRVRF